MALIAPLNKSVAVRKRRSNCFPQRFPYVGVHSPSDRCCSWFKLRLGNSLVAQSTHAPGNTSWEIVAQTTHHPSSPTLPPDPSAASYTVAAKTHQLHGSLPRRRAWCRILHPHAMTCSLPLFSISRFLSNFKTLQTYLRANYTVVSWLPTFKAKLLLSLQLAC